MKVLAPLNELDGELPDWADSPDSLKRGVTFTDFITQPSAILHFCLSSLKLNLDSKGESPENILWKGMGLWKCTQSIKKRLADQGLRTETSR